MTGAADRLGVPLGVVRDDRYGEEILVRPDHFISWVGDGTAADAEATLRRSVGA
jgi:hypothetical protein